MAGELKFTLGLVTGGFLSGLSQVSGKIQGFIGGLGAVASDLTGFGVTWALQMIEAQR